jgi:Septum formation
VVEPRARTALVILVVCAVGAALAVVALLALDGGEDDAEAGNTTTTPAGEPVAVDRIEVGTCFNDAGDEGAFDYTELSVVDCEAPHDNEVYHLFDAPGGAAYPGDDQIGQVTRDGCLSAFEPYVGKPYTESAFAILPIPPSETSWDGGDREVVCAVYDAGRRELTGSVRGSAR